MNSDDIYKFSKSKEMDRVWWIEQEQIYTISTTYLQSNPPWALDRIDQRVILFVPFFLVENVKCQKCQSIVMKFFV